MTRPPQPTQAIPGSPCPTCGALVPTSTHDGCPELERRRREAARVERDRARLFGIGKGGAV